MNISDELIDKMRKDQASGNPVTAMMADLWMQRYNIPFVTTIYEANQEMRAATYWSQQEAQNRK